MIIRSQDKTKLVTVNNIKYIAIRTEEKDQTYSITLKEDNDCILGYYKSECRAIQILDELTKHFFEQITYEMPQD